jgi:AraC-like DNA-binding protein
MQKWEKMLAVQRMQEFITKHLKEVITLSDLARAAAYSPWHAARTFKEVTGKPPFEYIRSLRLSRAAARLHDEDVRIIDVAFDFVFDSHEGFTRAFSREFGITPGYYAKNTPPLKLFMPEYARDYYIKLQKGEYEMNTKSNPDTVFVQVVDRPARKLILKRAKEAQDYFAYCTELGCDVYSELKDVKEALYEPVGMWLPKNLQKPGTSEYVMGVEMPADYNGPVPAGYEMIDLIPCKMMVFQGQPYDDADFEKAIGNLWAVMKTYKPEIYGFKWADEDGPRFQLAPMGYRGYIEARPVRQVNS